MTEPTVAPPAGYEARMTADVRADVALPDRVLTAEERGHLGLPKEEEK